MSSNTLARNGLVILGFHLGSALSASAGVFISPHSLPQLSLPQQNPAPLHRKTLTHQGIEILGAVLIERQGPAGVEREILGWENRPVDPSISVVPAFASSEASRIALGVLGDRNLQAAPALKILPSQSDDGSMQLIYWVTVSGNHHEAGRDILLNAQSGALIGDISHHLEIAPTHILSATDDCQRVDEESGAPYEFEINRCPLVIRSGAGKKQADETARRANANSQTVLQYYWTRHGRDSFDDRGTTLRSVVHVGKNFANAFWSSDAQFMAYGDGDGEVMTDLTKSLDVAGHEMTHGVTSATSKLIYMDESGALNEAFSDFFGIAISADRKSGKIDWAIGKDIFLNDRRLLGLRNLQNPASITARYRDDQGAVVRKPYPAHVKDQFQTQNPCGPENDRCFVHINSMIPGHAMYLTTEAIGLERAEKLFYATLTQYLTETSNFKIFRSQTLKACRALLTSGECAKVRTAFQQVGL